MSRGVYRSIHSSLVDDPDFQRLSARARHLLLTVRICKDAGVAVIFRYYPELLSRQTGLGQRQISQALEELARENWAYSDSMVLWVRNGLRHDPQVKLSSQKHRAGVIRQLQALPRSGIVARFCDYYQISKAIVGLSEAYPELASDTDTPKKKDTDTPSTEREPAPAVALPAVKPLARVPPFITEALDRSARLGAAPRLRSAEFWQAEARAANGTVDLAAEVLKAESWLVANPGRAPRKDLPRFLHNWLSKAKEFSDAR